MAQHPEPSVQLFSVRERLAADPAATLDRVAALGFRDVEPYGFGDDPGWWRDALHAAGLRAPTAHTTVIGADVAAVAAAARDLGVGTLVDPGVDPSRWRSRVAVRAFAERLTAAARIAADHGVAVAHHNHHDEIGGLVDERTALEVLAEELDDLDSPVELQLDAYWAVIGGADPAALLSRLGSRVTSLHLKDGPGRGDVHEQVALGRGDQPLDAILAAAPAARRIVELDTVAGEVLDDLGESLRWLRSRP